MLRSLGLATDILILRGRAVVQEHGDRVILRTPSEPDYWSGNALILKEDRIDADALIAQFRADLPDAGHVALFWDLPGPKPAQVAAAFEPLGFRVRTSDTLVLGGARPSVPAPDGIALREIASDADWTAVLCLQMETGIEEGYDPVAHGPYLARRIAACRAQAEAGMGAWFGAFDGALLVGDLGIYHDDRVARFQQVETRATHRRRGICAALVTHALRWAAARAPGAVPVIIAEAEEAPGRLYRRLGFSHRETTVEAIRGSY